MLVAFLVAAVVASGQPAALPPESNGAPTSDEIDALQQLYDSSCGSRGYGEYDDVCILITKQLNDAKAAAEKAKRAKPDLKPPTPAQSEPPVGPPKPAASGSVS